MLFVTLLKKIGCFKSENTRFRFSWKNMEQNTLQMDYKSKSLLSAPYEEAQSYSGTVQSKCDGTRWRTRGEVKGKLANGVGIQYPSHYLGTWCIQALLPPVVDWSDAPFDLNRFVRFAERRNLVSARVLSHFKRSLQKSDSAIRNLHIYLKIWLSGICSSSWSTLVMSYQTVRHHAQ
jgi:hypothetical protein